MRFLVSFVLLSLFSLPGHGATLTFQNSQMPPIPLLEEAGIAFDSHTRVAVHCQFTQGVCLQDGVPTGPRPSVSLSSSLGASVVLEEGQSLTVQWNAINGPHICVARPSAPMPAWEGSLAASGSKSILFAQAGNYALALECYNSAGSSTSPLISIEVQDADGPGPGPGDPQGCGIESSDPLFEPNGFIKHAMPWSGAFYGANYPTTGGYLNPIGSFTIGNMDINGRYLAIEFTPQEGQGLSLAWEQAQAVAFHNYLNSNPAGPIFIAISPCAGDFRLPVSMAAPPTVQTEDYRRSACRKFNQAGSIYLNTTRPSFNGCGIEAGRTYYLNLLFADPTDGLSPFENTCLVGNKCDANFQ